MTQETFLYKLRIKGELDDSLIMPLSPMVPSKKAEDLIAAFNNITNEYSPQELENKGKIPVKLMKKMADSGFFGITIPEEFGGLGLSFREYLMIVEQIAAKDIALAMVSLAHLSIGIEGIIIWGTDAQKSQYLSAAAAGKTVFAYALTEPTIGSDAQNIKTSAKLSPDGQHYILNGNKTYITNGGYAGAFTAFAQIEGGADKGMGAFIVERDFEGVEVGDELPKMGIKVSSTTPIKFTNVKVPVKNLIGNAGDGFKIAMTILNYGRLAVAAAGVGLMKQSLDDMTKRAQKRVQFGQPIISFELIKEKIAKAKVNSFAAETMVWAAANQLDRNPTANVAMETSHCKLFSTVKTWNTLYDAQQVAGGTGYLATAPYERRLRDWRVTTIFEGTTEIHSIYPVLFAARAVANMLPRENSARLVALVKRSFKRTKGWPWPYGLGSKRTTLLMHRLNLAFRWKFHYSLARYGNKLAEKQFLLRRLTWTSLSEFALRCALLRAKSDGGSEKEALIDYLAAESTQDIGSCANINERLIRKLVPWNSK